MTEYDASTHGEPIADFYDDLYGDIGDVDAIAEFLATRARFLLAH